MKARHYSNSQNLVISFEHSWFLAKKLSNFVSLSWKLHNRECHIVEVALKPTVLSSYFDVAGTARIFFLKSLKVSQIELNFFKVKMWMKLQTKKARNPQICTKINVRAVYFLCCNCKDVNQRHGSKSFSPANYDSQCGWIYYKNAIEFGLTLQL